MEIVKHVKREEVLSYQKKHDVLLYWLRHIELLLHEVYPLYQREYLMHHEWLLEELLVLDLISQIQFQFDPVLPIVIYEVTLLNSHLMHNYLYNSLILEQLLLNQIQVHSFIHIEQQSLHELILHLLQPLYVSLLYPSSIFVHILHSI